MNYQGTDIGHTLLTQGSLRPPAEEHMRMVEALIGPKTESPKSEEPPVSGAKFAEKHNAWFVQHPETKQYFKVEKK